MCLFYRVGLLSQRRAGPAEIFCARDNAVLCCVALMGTSASSRQKRGYSLSNDFLDRAEIIPVSSGIFGAKRRERRRFDFVGVSADGV